MNSQVEYTPRHASGFSDRLHIVLDHCQLPRHGRITTVAQLAGLSVNGAKLMFDSDRPPKRLVAFRGITKELARILKKTGHNIDEKTLEKYLLLNEENTVTRSWRPSTDNGAARTSKSSVEKSNLISDGKVIVAIHEIGNSLNLDLFEDIAPLQLEKLFRKTIDYCNETGADPSSDEVRELVGNMIFVAKKNLL